MSYGSLPFFFISRSFLLFLHNIKTQNLESVSHIATNSRRKDPEIGPHSVVRDKGVSRDM